MRVVLDASAVLRYLEDTEPAAELIAHLLGVERPLMSWINLGEVHYYVLRRSQGEEAAIGTVRDLREVIEVRLPDEHLVLEAARIKADYPMADADAFGAALSIAQDATLWTGDPELLVEDSPWHWRDLRSSAGPGARTRRSEWGSASRTVLVARGPCRTRAVRLTGSPTQGHRAHEARDQERHISVADVLPTRGSVPSRAATGLP